jgi:hypothetical protein
MTLIDPTNVRSSATAASGPTTEFRLKGKETKVFRYLVEMSGSSGWVEFDVESFHGRSASKRMAIRSGG